MPVRSQQIVTRLKEIGFNEVSMKATSHLKLKDKNGIVIMIPSKRGKDVKMGVIWNIERKLKTLKYPPLNLWK